MNKPNIPEQKLKNQTELGIIKKTKKEQKKTKPKSYEYPNQRASLYNLKIVE